MINLTKQEALAMAVGDEIEMESLMPRLCPDDPVKWVLTVKQKHGKGHVLDFDVTWCGALLRKTLIKVNDDGR